LVPWHFDPRDLILIAKTSFGKSIVLQSVSALLYGSITIVILPLIEIGKEPFYKVGEAAWLSALLVDLPNG
jgi:hypothetical protein